MRFTIEVIRTSDIEWAITINSAAPKVICHRSIRRSGAYPQVFPQPPTAEANALKTTDVHQKLCTTADPGDILEVYGHIVDKSIRGDEVKAFGRYLFATLISDDAWNDIQAEAQNAPIELALLWSESEWELHRLPWEMMQSSSGPLAADRNVSLSRLVPHGQTNVKELSLRPKILFVVGSELNDMKIKPGTEYLGMLHRLEDQNLRLNSRILDRATSQQVKDAMSTFQPSVVHFICHGGFDNKGNAYLELTPDKASDPPQQMYASALLATLGSEGLPPVVVLNACYTASVPRMREAPPLAFELVKGGIPVVVGMGGRVADVACRLFTRSFYETLIKGGSIVEATANGRRAGIMHIGANVDRIVDWSMPTLFLDQTVTPNVTVDPVWAAQAQQVELYAQKYRSINNPPHFCDRHEFMASYHSLLDTQPKVAGVQTFAKYSVLAVEVDAYEPRVKDPQYGKTRLLEELAAQAVRDGHVPCLITFAEDAKPPVKVMQLGNEILRAIWMARKTLSLETQPDYEFRKLEKQQTDPTVKLRKDVQEELDWATGVLNGKVVRAALKHDLLALQEEARIKLKGPDLKVLVLIDEVHRFDDAARELVNNMIESNGLGTDANPVPVVFTFSAASVKPEYNATVQVLRDFLDKLPLYVIRLPLGAFPPPTEEWLLYQQFLIYQDPPLIVPEEKEDKDVYETLYDEIMGVPSQLNGVGIQAAIRSARKYRFLVEANDEEVLKKQSMRP